MALNVCTAPSCRHEWFELSRLSEPRCPRCNGRNHRTARTEPVLMRGLRATAAHAGPAPLQR